jgi:hypothetical protein
MLILEPTSTEMNLDEESTNLATRECSTALPIAVDERYNLIVCKECGIGLPSDWVVAHLKEHHGVRTTMEEALTLLGVGDYAMTLAEAENWIQNMWVGIAVQNIPVVKGFRCKECQYSARLKMVLKNHFSKEHKGLKRVENSEECNVQLIFKAGLRKYIQVKEDDEMEVESERNMGWNMAIEREFRESMANVRISGLNGHGNLRLMNVFIAKTRWDVLVEGKDLKELVNMAAAPIVSHNLQQIMLCGRRYLHKTCAALNKGSVIIKRLLMSGGYLISSHVSDQ